MKMINDQGGVNGRKINLIQYDDAYSPPKTVEQVRKLVESDEVLLTFQMHRHRRRTPPCRNISTRKKVPQLFAATGASKFTDPKNFPWTMGFNPNYFVEGRIYGTLHPERTIRTPRSASSTRTTISAKTTINGIKAGLGDKAAKMIVAEASYEVSDPTINSQILKIKDAGADLFFSASTPKQAAQAIKKIHELNWKPVHILDINASLGQRRDEAGRARGLQGRDQRQLRQGSARSDLEGRCRHEEVFRLHGEVLSRWRQGHELQFLRLLDRAVAGPRAQDSAATT